MVKKVLLGLVAAGALAGLIAWACSAAKSAGYDQGVVAGIESGKKLGLAEGHAEGFKVAVDNAPKWHCVEVETPADGNKILFCTNTVANRDMMCNGAKAQAEMDPGMNVLGCPDVAVLPVSME